MRGSAIWASGAEHWVMYSYCKHSGAGGNMVHEPHCNVSNEVFYVPGDNSEAPTIDSWLSKF